MQENSLEKFVQLIANAFADTDFPSRDAIFIPSAGHIFDVEQAIVELGNKPWSDVPINILQRNKDRISYLTPQAFHFYIPAFLIAITEKPAEVDVLRENIIASLIPSNNELAQSLFDSRSTLFSIPQIEAILNFFENYTVIYPPDKWSYSTDDQIQVERAIDFWQYTLKNRTDTAQ